MPEVNLDKVSTRKTARVIVVRGAPGVGKTTVAKKIRAMLKTRKKAHISIDQLQECDLRGPSKDKMKLGIYHAALMVRSFVREGFDVIVDYVFDIPSDLEFFVENVFRSHSGPVAPTFVQVFYLDAPYETVRRRNTERALVMNEGLLKKLHKACDKTKSCLVGETIIDTATLSPINTARAIVNQCQGLSSPGKKSHIQVD
ncbi:MAG: AAA family ATPase [Candidatus Hydrogenedentes bacterium]|nr:AAA family ATPase [Candidatus Hydrogenedentota bacterium]